MSRIVFLGVVVCLWHATGVAWAKESLSPDSESKLDGESNTNPREKTDAELMYDAMKRSGPGSSDDVAIDRALARAQKDSEKRRKALRQALVARSWKDPFADNVAVPIRSRRTARNDNDELRAARAEAARARRATAMARAEAALARAETAQARATAARAEAIAARADAVAARQACVALPARDDGNRQAGARRTYADTFRAAAKPRFRPTGRAASPSETSRRAITPATLTVSSNEESAESPPPTAAAPSRPLTGIIVVPIPPPSH